MSGPKKGPLIWCCSGNGWKAQKWRCFSVASTRDVTPRDFNFHSDEAVGVWHVQTQQIPAISELLEFLNQRLSVDRLFGNLSGTKQMLLLQFRSVPLETLMTHCSSELIKWTSAWWCHWHCQGLARDDDIMTELFSAFSPLTWGWSYLGSVACKDWNPLI